MSFLQKDYEVPATPSRYMKLEEGGNIFRVLSNAIVGYEYWNEEGKPVRLKEMPPLNPDDIRKEDDGSTRMKHFWAFVVWNYKTEAIEILEITQKTIQDPIKELVGDEQWGDPHQYDIKIMRKGQGLDTEYTVMPQPHKDVSIKVAEAFENTPVNLEALFTGEDPFKV